MTAPLPIQAAAGGPEGVRPVRFVAGLPDTSMCGPHRHRHVHQVFGYSDAAHIAETVYNTLRRQDGRPRWQDLDMTSVAHVSLRDEALREAERQKAETRARRRAKRQRENEAAEAALAAMRAEGKRCGNCNAASDPPGQSFCNSEPGQLTCDLYSDFHGYVLVWPSDICAKWSPGRSRLPTPAPDPGAAP